MNSSDRYIRRRITLRNRSSKLYAEILKRDEYKCAICGWGLPFRTPSGRNQVQSGCDIHHIIPVKDGGLDVPDNLVLLCPNHHKEADTGFIAVEELRKCTDKPTNILEWLKKQHKKKELKARHEQVST